jgi:hypothetical protein
LASCGTSLPSPRFRSLLRSHHLSPRSSCCFCLPSSQQISSSVSARSGGCLFCVLLAAPVSWPPLSPCLLRRHRVSLVRPAAVGLASHDSAAASLFPLPSVPLRCLARPRPAAESGGRGWSRRRPAAVVVPARALLFSLVFAPRSPGSCRRWLVLLQPPALFAASSACCGVLHPGVRGRLQGSFAVRRACFGGVCCNHSYFFCASVGRLSCLLGTPPWIRLVLLACFFRLVSLCRRD